MKKEHKNILPLFVFAGTTGKLQPAGVILQRFIRHVVREKLSLHIADLVQVHLNKGNSIESFKLDVGIKYFKNIVPGLLRSAFEYVQSKPELVLKAWAKSSVPSHGLNLLSVWDNTVQDKAVELFASSELFPAQK